MKKRLYLVAMTLITSLGVEKASAQSATIVVYNGLTDLSTGIVLSHCTPAQGIGTPGPCLNSSGGNPVGNVIPAGSTATFKTAFNPANYNTLYSEDIEFLLNSPDVGGGASYADCDWYFKSIKQLSQLNQPWTMTQSASSTSDTYVLNKGKRITVTPTCSITNTLEDSSAGGFTIYVTFGHQ